MRKIVVALAALAFLAPSSAHAIAFVGARVGYAMPSGDWAKGQPIKDDLKSNLPIQVDAGLSFLNILSIGAYGSYGPTQVKSECSTVYSSCSGSSLRAGLQLNLRPPLMLKELWGGVFAGYEQQTLKGTAQLSNAMLPPTIYTYNLDAKYSGWEAGLQAGWDFSILPFIGIGPYVSYSIGQFTSASGTVVQASGASQGLSIGTKAQHQAFTIGLRGIFDL